MDPAELLKKAVSMMHKEDAAASKDSTQKTINARLLGVLLTIGRPVLVVLLHLSIILRLRDARSATAISTLGQAVPDASPDGS